MWDAIKNVKTIIGLVAVSIGLSYLLAKQLIDAQLIKSSFEALFLICFFIVFIIGALVFAMIGSKRKKFGSSQRAFGSENKQRMTSKNIVDKEVDANRKQTAVGKGNQQHID